MKRKYIIFTAIISVFICLCYIYIIPFQKINKIKNILKSKHTEALSEHIDFPLLRENVKSQLKASFINNTDDSEEMTDNLFSGLTLGLGNILIDKMVDSLITPSGIHSVIMGHGFRNFFNESSDVNHSEIGKSSTTSKSEIHMSYQSLNQFDITIGSKDDPKNKIQLILRRTGLSWKLTNVIFPLSNEIKNNLNKRAYVKKENQERNLESVESTIEKIKIKILSKGFYEGNFTSKITMDIKFINKTNKAIRGFEGYITFYDIFDNKIKSISISYDQGVPANGEKIWSGGIDYNQFIDADKKLKGKSLENLTYKWQLKTIIYSDNSKEVF